MNFWGQNIFLDFIEDQAVQNGYSKEKRMNMTLHGLVGDYTYLAQFNVPTDWHTRVKIAQRPGAEVNAIAYILYPHKFLAQPL